jgi:hypothetical protein
VTRLIIFTRSAKDQPELAPSDIFKLDRYFLTGADTDERYSARRPPKIFYGPDGWYVSNETSNQTVYLWSPDGRLVTIEPGLAARLEDGESDIQIGDYEVTLLVSPAEARPQQLPNLSVPVTWPPDRDAEDELRRQIKARPPAFRVIMYARFQEYITPPPHFRAGPFLARRPSPLTAADTEACCGPAVSQSAVHEVSRSIRSITGLPLWQVGDWLVRRGILLPKHNIDIPHTACSHQGARSRL